MSKNIKVPQLRFKEFSGEWKEKRIENIFSIFSGFSFLSLDATKVGVKLVKIADIGIQEMKKDNISFLPESFLNKYDKFVLHTNDIVLALTRPILNKKLKVSKIDEFFNNSLLNQRTGKIITIESLNYIYYLLQNEKLIDKINLSIMGSEPPNLSINQIKSLGASLPQKQEQEKIASFLSKIDTKIEQLTKKDKLINSYKKGVMQKIFSQEIRFSPKGTSSQAQGETDDGNDYSDWEEKELGSFTNIKTGNKDTQNKIENGKYPFFVRSNTIERINSFSFDGESILTAGDGVGVGKVFHYLNEKFDYHQRVYNIHNFDDNVNGKYIFFYFKENFYKRVIKLSAKNSVDSVRMEMIYKMKIPLPCLEEQTKIAKFLSSIDTKIEQNKKVLELTKEFKKALLQTMFV